MQHLLKDTPPFIPSVSQVKTTLKVLNTRKAIGVDAIPAWCLKGFCEEFAPVVHDIIVSRITQCKYPSAYKHTLVSPMPKVRPSKDIDSVFRQVSVLPHLAKILEKLQLKLNNTALKARDNQHAFSNGRSTVYALTTISQDWFDATDNSKSGRKGVHALFTDFRKAFDLVNYKILLKKLALRNINKYLWLWLKSFLEGRTQQVRLGEKRSFTAFWCPSLGVYHFTAPF